MQKGVFYFEYLDDWEKLNETSLPEKVNFYSDLNMGNINDADYERAKRVCKDFEIKDWDNIMTCMFKIIHCC